MRTIEEIKQDSKPIIFLGSSSSMENLVEICKLNDRKVLGIVDPDYASQSELHGLPILDKDTYFSQADQYEFFVASWWFPFKPPVFQRDREKRNMLLGWMKEYNLTGANIIHPTAVVSSSTKIDRNVAIGALSVILCNTTIHKNTVIREQTYISHDVEIGENSVIQIKATVTGRIKIGKNAYIGVGSTIMNGMPITVMPIGDNVLVHPTMLVLNELPDNAVVGLKSRTDPLG
jgi:serine acetyltransferase